eukprot:jgi/Botrbrau1/20439/Bobra.145_2s0004.1
MGFEHLAYLGDVTALCFTSIPDERGHSTPVLLAGTGSELHVYRLQDGSIWWRGSMLSPGIRIHGVKILPCEPHGIFIGIHGDRCAQVIRLQYSPVQHQFTATVVLPTCNFPAWTHDMLILPPSPRAEALLDDASGQVSTPAGVPSMSDAPLAVHALPLKVVVGLSNNSVHVLSISGDPTRHRHSNPDLQGPAVTMCSEKSLLYSMCLVHSSKPAELLVAAGTIFLDVLVWKAFAPWNSTVCCLYQPPLFRLKGHEGSIHSLRWGAAGALLASGSDDRTVRLWKLPAPHFRSASVPQPEAGQKLPAVTATLLAASKDGLPSSEASCPVSSTTQAASPSSTPKLFPDGSDGGGGGGVLSSGREESCAGENMQALPADQSVPQGQLCGVGDEPVAGEAAAGVPELEPVWVSYGHNGRIWDVQFGDGFLVTGSEDCSCKIWSLATGECLATLKGHKGRGIWRCALEGPLLASAGNDACIRVWNISADVPAPPPASPQASALDGRASAGTSRAEATSLPRASVLPEPMRETGGRGPLRGREERRQRQSAGAPAADELECGGLGGGTRGQGINAQGEQVLNIPGAGFGRPNGKPHPQEKIKCLALAGDATVYVATAGGVLWRTSFGAQTSEDWHRVWDSPSQSPINSLVVLPWDPGRTGRRVVSNRVGPGPGGRGPGFEPLQDQSRLHVFFGAQDGMVRRLVDCPCLLNTSAAEGSTACWSCGTGEVALPCEGGVLQSERAETSGNEPTDLTSLPHLGWLFPDPTTQEQQPVEGGTAHQAGRAPTPSGGSEAQGGGEPTTEAGADTGLSRLVEWEADCGLPILKVLPLGRPQWADVALTTTTAKRLRVWDVQRGGASCIAEAKSPFSSKVVAAEALPEQELLVCGDQGGHVFAYVLPSSLLLLPPPGSNPDPLQLLLVANLFEVHQASMVNLIQTGPWGTVLSGGRDGTIVHYRYHAPEAVHASSPRQAGDLTEKGMVGDFDLPTVAEGSQNPKSAAAGPLRICNQDRLGSVTVVTHCVTGPDGERLACGFQAADWVVYSLSRSVVVLRVPCGGWRRPYDAVVRTAANVTFAYCKDGTIHIIRRAVPPVPPVQPPVVGDQILLNRSTTQSAAVQTPAGIEAQPRGGPAGIPASAHMGCTAEPCDPPHPFSSPPGGTLQECDRDPHRPHSGRDVDHQDRDGPLGTAGMGGECDGREEGGVCPPGAHARGGELAAPAGSSRIGEIGIDPLRHGGGEGPGRGVGSWVEVGWEAGVRMRETWGPNAGARGVLEGGGVPLAGAPQTLSSLHHGREVHCVAFLQAPPRTSSSHGSGGPSVSSRSIRPASLCSSRPRPPVRDGSGGPGSPQYDEILVTAQARHSTAKPSHQEGLPEGPVGGPGGGIRGPDAGTSPQGMSVGHGLGRACDRAGGNSGETPTRLEACAFAVVTGSEDGSLRKVLLRGSALGGAEPRHMSPESQAQGRDRPVGLQGADSVGGRQRAADGRMEADQDVGGCGEVEGPCVDWEGRCGTRAAVGLDVGIGACVPGFAAVQPLYGSGQIGEHAAGTVVRAMAVVALPEAEGSTPRRHVVVTAGSKEVMAAWLVSWEVPQEGSQQEGDSLSHEWLGSRAPPRGGLRRKSTRKGEYAMSSDQRYLAVTAVLARGRERHASMSNAVVNILAAASDATLRLIAFHLGTRRWTVVADFRQHTSPVLSLTSAEGSTSFESAACASSNVSHRVTQLAFSGSTSGDVAIWDVSLCKGEFPVSWGGLVPEGDGAIQGTSGSLSGAHSPGGGTVTPSGLPSVTPLWVLEAAHQSGVNALSACFQGPSRLVLVAGGDDQAIRIALLDTAGIAAHASRTGDSNLRLKLQASLLVPNAHFSAIRGVWTDGTAVFSAGLDQTVRKWRIQLVRKDAQVEPPAHAEAASTPEPQHDEKGGTLWDCLQADTGCGPPYLHGDRPASPQSRSGDEAVASPLPNRVAAVALQPQHEESSTVADPNVRYSSPPRRTVHGAPATRDEDSCDEGSGGLGQSELQMSAEVRGRIRLPSGPDQDCVSSVEAPGSMKPEGKAIECGIKKGIQLHLPTSVGSTEAGLGVVSDGELWVVEVARAPLQVLEPGALAVHSAGAGSHIVAVVGRGTEILISPAESTA